MHGGLFVWGRGLGFRVWSVCDGGRRVLMVSSLRSGCPRWAAVSSVSSCLHFEKGETDSQEDPQDLEIVSAFTCRCCCFCYCTSCCSATLPRRYCVVLGCWTLFLSVHFPASFLAFRVLALVSSMSLCSRHLRCRCCRPSQSVGESPENS